MRRLLPAAFIAAALLPAGAARAADLVVTVQGVQADSGDVRVVVIADPDGLARQDMSRNLRAATAKDGVIVTHFLGVSPGPYGVIATHDSHVNHAIEKMMTGSVSKPESTSTEARIVVAEPSTPVTLVLK
jgi:uncharacterized protein (DUF2141 family)